jgi:hypothetical protein
MPDDIVPEKDFEELAKNLLESPSANPRGDINPKKAEDVEQTSLVRGGVLG